jgi:ATP-dependent DNA ligase
VKLYSRPGNDLTHRFPLIVETLLRLRSRSCIIDGEAVACDDNGVTSFNRVRYRHHDESIFLYAFDLIELNGDDLRRERLEDCKATLEMILAKADFGISNSCAAAGTNQPSGPACSGSAIGDFADVKLRYAVNFPMAKHLLFAP